MKAYSLDLRQKIVATYQAGGISQRDLAVRFCVSPFFVYKLLRLARRGEQLQARQRGGQVKPKLNDEMRRFLRAELAMQNDLTLSELASRLKSRFGVQVSPPTICRALKTMELRRKKRRLSPLKA